MDFELAMKQPDISVLVVDDHPVVREGYRRLLESTGDISVVAEAESGETAYEQFKRHRPDVTIMDLVMPGSGGLGAIRLRHQCQRENIPSRIHRQHRIHITSQRVHHHRAAGHR